MDREPTSSAGVDFVLNGTRSSGDVEDRIRKIADRCGVPVRIHVAQSGSDITSLARQVSAGPGHRIVAGGGDGTVSAVASALVDTVCALGVLPLGTLNHFAKDLKIPLEIEAAVQLALGGTVVRVDVGEVNGHVFLNNSSLGLYPRLVHLREKQQRSGSPKWIAFARALVAVMRQYSRVHINLSPDQQGSLVHDTPFLFVGNNRYEMTGFEMGSRTALDQGRLWVCIAPRADRMQLMMIGLRALANRLKSSDLDAFETAALTVSTRHRQRDVSADGEVIRLDAPLRFRIRPGALRVVVPVETGNEISAAG